MSLAAVFFSEYLGTSILIVLGCGVVANVTYPNTGGSGGGFLLINVGWGVGVFAGVYAAYKSGGHLNPAVTIALLVEHLMDHSVVYAPGVPVTLDSTLVYISAQMLGAFTGAVLCWMAYKKQFEERDDADSLVVFSTAPQVRSMQWNLVTEIVGTFVLVFVVLTLDKTPAGLGPLAVGLLVVGIGASLGGPTGYAINPARDLGPRIAHAVLPIHDKASSNWSYSWIPVVGPIVGGVLAALVGHFYIT